MKVFGAFGTEVTTDPKAPGIYFRGGDVCDPRDGEQLNGPPWPTEATRWFCARAVLPFVSARFDFLAALATVLIYIFTGSAPVIIAALVCTAIWLSGRASCFGFYVGWKCYGFDSDAYKNWCGGEYAAEVYGGSRALELTVRFFSDG